MQTRNAPAKGIGAKETCGEAGGHCIGLVGVVGLVGLVGLVGVRGHRVSAAGFDEVVGRALHDLLIGDDVLRSRNAAQRGGCRGNQVGEAASLSCHESSLGQHCLARRLTCCRTNRRAVAVAMLQATTTAASSRAIAEDPKTGHRYLFFATLRAERGSEGVLKRVKSLQHWWWHKQAVGPTGMSRWWWPMGQL